MFGWSLKLFRVRGIQLAVHWSFFLLLAYVAWEGARGFPNPEDPSEIIGGGWDGLRWNVGMLLSFFTCVVLHELGHSFTAMHFGVGVRRILLMPIGGMAEFDNIPRQPGREFLITLAGPAVNFAIAAVLGLLVGLPQGWPVVTEVPTTARGFAQLLVHWNILMGCFNLVPVFPMDGGRLFRATLATKLPYLRATFIAASVGKVLASVGMLLAVFVFDWFMLAMLFAFIFVAGELEYRAVRRREIDDAHWREVVARLYISPPPSEEPPVLLR